MRRASNLSRLFFVLLCLIWIASSAVQAAPSAQGGPAVITSFTTSAASVTRGALANRTARVPVTWETENRPITANLVFEQIMPDGSAVNVELPRPIPYVASSGTGVAAPILPAQNAAQITLRVRLVSLINGEVLSERQLTLPIVEGDGTGNNTNRPAITEFTACCEQLYADELANRSARLGVTWSVVNRPVSANLVFEQVLPDGSVANIELPRDNPLVASSGSGVVAPLLPAPPATSVILRLRLFDLLNGRVYDQRILDVPFLPPGTTPTATPPATLTPLPPAPVISRFTLGASSVDPAQLANGSARIPVSFTVDNRPPNSNLVFEQIMSDGSRVNVELPRPNPIIPSSGDGVVAPRSPGGSATTVRLLLSVIDLDTNAILTFREVSLPIIAPPTATLGPTPTVTPTGQRPPRLFYVFTDVGAAVDAAQAAAGTQRIPIQWQVSDRPDNSNLVFEQLLPNGTVVNVELPRNFVIVPSTGSGVIAPRYPGQGVAEAQFRVRLVNLADNSTIDQRTLVLPVRGSLPAQAAGQTAPTPTPACPARFSGEGCAAEPPQVLSAITQQFERGTAIRLMETGVTYILLSDGSLGSTSGGEAPGEVPQGLFAPAPVFASAWTLDRLGWGITPEGAYIATMQRLPPDPQRNMQDILLSLPDGRVALLTGANNQVTNWQIVG